ncbi:MAG: extracellular solute-binding protein [Minisyncoccia bacterium]
MKMSLFRVILIGVFGLSAFIGLFVFATHNSSNSGSGGIGTVVIWGVLPKTEMQNILVGIARDNPSMKDVSYVQKDERTLSVDLTSAIASGSPPDLVLASQESLLVLSKFIEPIPLSTLPVSAYTSTFIGGGEIFMSPSGAGYYGIPFLVDPLVLFSNRAILSSSGVTMPPATWEAFTGLVPRTALFTPTKQVTRGLVALGTYDNIRNARAILSSFFLQTGVPIASYKNGILVADLSGHSSGATPGQAVLNFYTQFADPSKVSYTWNASLPNSQQAFLAGDLALYIGYVSEARYLRVANPNLDLQVSLLPQLATATLKSTYGNIYAFMIPHGARNQSGAYQAAALLTGNGPQTVAASAFGLAPASLTPLAEVPSDPAGAVAYTEALYTAGWLSPLPADTDAIFSGMINSVISGRLTPNTALTTGGAALTALLQK